MFRLIKIGHLNQIHPEPLVNLEYVYIPLIHDNRHAHQRLWSRTTCADDPARRSRSVGSSRLAGAGSSGPARGRLINFERVALALLAAITLSSCADAGAATTTKKKSAATTRKKVTKKPVSTKKPVTTQRATTTTSLATTPKLSIEAKAVLQGYEAYLQAYVAGSREPERAAELYAKGMTGDALAKLIEIANFDVTNGQYWDGTRADIISKGRVETIGATRATLRDCRSVGGVLRKRATNEPVSGTTSADIDDLFVDLVKIDGRWVVTRTDRSNQEEGRATCVPGSSP